MGIRGNACSERLPTDCRYSRGRLIACFAIEGADWAEEEIDELGHTLSTTIKEYTVGQKWIIYRLKWNTSLAVLIVARILEQHAIGNDSALTFAEQDIIRRRCALLSYSLEIEESAMS